MSRLPGGTAALLLCTALACLHAHLVSAYTIKDVRSAADLRAAFADQNVAEARLLTDVQLDEQAWPATSVVSVAPGRTLVITSRPGVQMQSWPLLDLGFLPARVSLGLRANITCTRIFLRGIRLTSQSVYPGERAVQ